MDDARMGDARMDDALWRPLRATYDEFTVHLDRAAGFPTLLPWPIPPGWQISDFAHVGQPGSVLASMTCTSGVSAVDGPVDVVLVCEDIGAGLGCRVAGLPNGTPLQGFDAGAPMLRLRLETGVARLWPVDVSESADHDRMVCVGEAGGRWLWLMLRPASALLMVNEEWLLRDATGLGPALVEVPFGGPTPAW